ncbi:class I SAM-dependent methyltransferase [Oxalobacteraceae bacterium CAVE-383]|nr:class I SAM-dependent methyltransferase [Oxalobacteraceae bacterium CAVE-383]
MQADDQTNEQADAQAGGADLTRISEGTLAHYSARAADFREGTRDHDVSQNIAALLRALGAEVESKAGSKAGAAQPAAGPVLTILDFGCGPGRDLATFTRLGHRAIGLDGTPEFVEMARRDSACEVWLQDFLKLDLPAAFFDGIYANASLFHVPGAALPRVLGELHAALKPGGALFCSNPRGDNEEGWNRGRYGAYHDLAAWRASMAKAGFTEIEHYYRPAGLPREQQPWLASVWRKG